MKLQNNTGGSPGLALVAVDDDVVGGGVQVVGNSLKGTEVNDLEVARDHVHSNVVVRDNFRATSPEGFPIAVFRVTTEGNLEVNNNTAAPAPEGQIRVNLNTVTNTLACQNNEPPPVGSGNTAKKKTGQCASL